jgi:cytochrome c-type biogenesis protein CcmH/NrfG
VLLDKRKVSYITKIGAIIIAVLFAASYVVYLVDFSPTATSTTQQPQQQASQRITAAQQAVQANPKNAGAWIKLGDAYYDAGSWQNAAASYQKGLELDPNNYKSRVDMSVAYYGMGQVDTATAEVQKAIAVAPNFAPAYYNLGVFLSSKGDSKAAIQAYEKYLQLAPGGDKASEAKAQIDVLKKAK